MILLTKITQILLYCTVWSADGALKLQHEANLYTQLVLEAIVNISDIYLNKDSPVIVLSHRSLCNTPCHFNFTEKEDEDSIVQFLHESNKWTILTPGNIEKNITNIYVKTGRTSRPMSLIIILNCEEYNMQLLLLHYMVMSLIHNRSFNPRARCVVVSTSLPSNRDQQNHVLNTFLRLTTYWWIYDAIVIIPEITSDTSKSDFSLKSSLEIFTKYPYNQQSNCDKEVGKIIFLDRWFLIGNQIGPLRNTNLFPSKVPKNLWNCGFVFRTSPWPPLVMTPEVDINSSIEYKDGLEIRILNQIAKSTNFKVLYSQNNSILTQAIFGATWIQGEIGVEYTWPHFTGAVTWFVPRERELPQWLSLIKIFDPLFWLFVLLAYILGSFTFWILGNCPLNEKELEIKGFSNMTLIFINTLGTVLSESVYGKPRRTLSQIFFILWLFYCLQINNAYQSSLIGVLAEPGNLPPIRNVHELIESGIQIGIQSGMQNYLDDNEQKQLKVQNAIELNDYTKKYCLDKMAYEMNLAVLAGRVGIEFIGYTNYTFNGKPLYVPFHDNVQEGHMAFRYSIGHLLVVRFNKIIHRLQSAGIIYKWLEEIRRKYGKHFNQNLRGKEFYVLTLSHIEGAYYLLILGEILAFVVFLTEIIWNFYVLQSKENMGG
ncbi:Ionotropic receptor 512 [Blattella germanica]|nr:Ionotropic receptor 512 [Blattella germanica]